jgi:outer membrane immunogenic protein
MTISILPLARRQFSCAVAAVSLLTTLPLTASFAADLALKSQPAVAAPLWTAFYIGIHGGGAMGNSRLEDPDFQITYDRVTVDSRGSLAGVQVGADWQFGSLVAGGELDASWSSIKGSLAPDPNFFLSGLSVQYQALATGTGRVGYAVGNSLAYVKGGVAWANIDYKSALATAFPIDVNHQRTGLTGGAGLEMALLDSLSARIEYDYMYFGSAAIALGTRRNPSNVDHELHLVKLGLNWRFTGDYLLARH